VMPLGLGFTMMESELMTWDATQSGRLRDDHVMSFGTDLNPHIPSNRHRLVTTI
jgi:hypothetical protein